jgi:hypothetical protein
MLQKQTIEASLQFIFSITSSAMPGYANLYYISSPRLKSARYSTLRRLFSNATLRGGYFVQHLDSPPPIPVLLALFLKVTGMYSRCSEQW